MALTYDWSQLASLPNFMSESIAKGQIVAAVRAKIPALQNASIDTLYNAAIAEMLNGGIALPINVTLPPSRTTPDLSTFLANNARYNWKDFSADVTGATDTAPTVARVLDSGMPASAEHFVPAGVLQFDTNTTFSHAIRFDAGAVLRPAAGVTLTFLDDIRAGSQQIFDLSAGGKVDFEGNTRVYEFDPRWFGVQGDNVVDDGPALLATWASVPDGATLQFRGRMVMRLTTRLNLWAKVGVKVLGAADPREGQGSGNYTAFAWDGAAGGEVIYLNRCIHTLLKDLDLSRSSGCLTTVLFDQNEATTPNLICSNNRVERCLFVNAAHLAGWRGIWNSKVSGDNCEFHEFVNNYFTGDGNFRWLTGLLSMAAGSTTITSPAAFTDSWLAPNTPVAGQPGATIRVAGAGPAGGVLETTIVSVTDASTIVVADAASVAVSNVTGQVERSLGIGIDTGASPNVHRLIIEHNTFQLLGEGVRAGGHFLGYRNNFIHNRWNYHVTGNPLPSRMEDENCEYSRGHVWLESAQNPMIVSGLRMDIENAAMGSGVFYNQSGQPILAEAIDSENDFRAFTEAQQSLFKQDQGFKIFVRGLRGNAPSDVIGIPPDQIVIGEGVTGYTYALRMISGTNFGYNSTNDRPGMRIDQAMSGDFNAASYLAIAQHKDASAYTPNVGNEIGLTLPTYSTLNDRKWIAGYVSTFGENTQQAASNDHWISFWARGPIWQDTDPAKQPNGPNDYIGLLVTAPERYTGVAGQVNSAQGVRIEAMKGETDASGAAHVAGESFGINQLGRQEVNFLRGNTAIAAPNAAPDDATMLDVDSMLTPWVDEAAGQLNFRIRKSDASLVTAALPFGAGSAVPTRGPAVDLTTGTGIDFSVDHMARMAFAANSTIGAVTNPVAEGVLTIELHNTDSAAHTVTLPGSINAPNLNAPSVPASSTRALTFVYNATRSLWICVGDVTV